MAPPARPHNTGLAQFGPVEAVGAGVPPVVPPSATSWTAFPSGRSIGWPAPSTRTDPEAAAMVSAPSSTVTIPWVRRRLAGRMVTFPVRTRIWGLSPSCENDKSPRARKATAAPSCARRNETSVSRRRITLVAGASRTMAAPLPTSRRSPLRTVCPRNARDKPMRA